MIEINNDDGSGQCARHLHVRVDPSESADGGPLDRPERTTSARTRQLRHGPSGSFVHCRGLANRLEGMTGCCTLEVAVMVWRARRLEWGRVRPTA